MKPLGYKALLLTGILLWQSQTVLAQNFQFNQPLTRMIDKKDFKSTGFPSVVSVTPIDKLNVKLELDNGKFKNMALPTELQGLSESKLISVFELVKTQATELEISPFEDNGDIMSIQDFLAEVKQEAIQSGLNIKSSNTVASILNALVIEDIGNSYIDISTQVASDVQQNMDLMRSAMDGICCTGLWDDWLNGAYTPDMTSDPNSKRGGVKYEDGTQVSYYEDSNGVRHYTVTDPDTGITYEYDNDADDNGYPDYNNDGGFDWPFINNITAEAEAHGRIHRLNQPENIFVNLVVLEFYATNKVKDLYSSLYAGKIDEDKFMEKLNKAFVKFMTSDTFEDMSENFVEQMGRPAPQFTQQGFYLQK